MNDASFGYYQGVNGVVTNDVDPIIGAINTSTGAISNENAVNSTMFSQIVQPSTGSVAYYGGAYRRQETSGGVLKNGRITNRAGALWNLSAGIPRVVSSNPTDIGTLGAGAGVGLQVRLTAKVGGAWVTQYVNLNGTSMSSDVAGGVLTVDVNSAARWELLFNDVRTTRPGDIGCFIGSQLCAVIRGTTDPRRGVVGQGNSLCSAECRVAVASAKNSTILGASGRLVPPSGVGSFSYPVVFGANASVWAGSDQSIPLPGGDYVYLDYFGYCVEFTAFAGIPAPKGSFEVDIELIGNE